MTNIIKYPSTILRTPSESISKFDSNLVEIIAFMISTMNLHNGIGLAAPQIGISKRIIVIKPPNKEAIAFINAHTTRKGIRTKTMIEGCLSLPGIHGKVERPHKFEFEAQDIQGNKKQYYYEGLTGRIIQHEIDHLNGILIIDHFKKNDLDNAKPILKLLEKSNDKTQ